MCSKTENLRFSIKFFLQFNNINSTIKNRISELCILLYIEHNNNDIMLLYIVTYIIFIVDIDN